MGALLFSTEKVKRYIYILLHIQLDNTNINIITPYSHRRLQKKMKNLSIKQAQKWLQKIKETDPLAYKDLGKCLRRFDQNNDEHECFLKMNQTLYNLPVFTQQINTYMDEGNKFIVNTTLKQRLDTFFEIVRNTKQELLKQIVEYVRNMANQQRSINQLSDQQATQIIKTGIIQIVKNIPTLLIQAEKIIPIKPEDALKLLDLKHLKNRHGSGSVGYHNNTNSIQNINVNNSVNKKIDEQQNDKQSQIRKIKRSTQPQNYNITLSYPASYNNNADYLDQQKSKQPNLLSVPSTKSSKYYNSNINSNSNSNNNPILPSFLSTSDQKLFIKQIQKKIGTFYYNQLMKMLQLYHRNVITRLQFMEMVENVLKDQIYGFKDIIQARQISRRKVSLFKPLSDINFHILPRETHSYVQIPNSYPHYAQNRTKQIKQIFNNQWVSVPRGSQVTFNVRIKNIYELALNKCQDQRYQFDLLLKRYKKILEIFKKVAIKLQNNDDMNVNSMINSAISLGVLQMLYKNATKQQKQVLENSLKYNTLQAIKIYQIRIMKCIEDLQQYRKIYAMKTWNQVANKNFYKSLDFKNHEFKNNQKLKMRPQQFVNELNENYKYLESRGTKKINQNPFGEHKQFFSILNSFEACSRKQKCIKNVQIPHKFQIQKCRFPTLLPAMIMSFENAQSFQLTCSFVSYYIEFSIFSQGEKSRCKNMLRQILSKFFKSKKLNTKVLVSSFDEQQFFTKILPQYSHTSSMTAPSYTNTSLDSLFDSWTNTYTQKYQQSSISQQKNSTTLPYFNSFEDDCPPEYNFQPAKSNRNVVFYGSDHFYVLLRFLYALYQRVVRMREISAEKCQGNGDKLGKIKAFQILYLACIKTKQSVKFQQALNLLFGQYSYLFTTIYRIVQNLCKSLNTVSLSLLQNHSLTLMPIKNQQVYLLLLNRYMLNYQSNINRLIRTTFQIDHRIIYVNSFNSYYRFCEDNYKEFNKKRVQMAKNIEQYTERSEKSERLQRNQCFMEGSEENEGKLKKKQNNNAMVPEIQQKCSNFVNRQQYYFENLSNKLINIACFEDYLIGNRESNNVTQDNLDVKKQLEKLKKIKLYK